MELENKEINCPKCNQKVTLDENLENIKCKNCQKFFFYKKCLKCSKYILFDNNINYDGYNIHCPYISCEEFFCLIKCENKECRKNIFYMDKYSQGDKIKCSFCKASFKKVKCPNKDCQENKILDINFLEGHPLECKHKDENFIFQKVGCWFCGRHCVWNNSKGKYYIEGQMIICPYKECEKVTNKVICPKCKNSSVITRGNLDMGKKINCQIKGCENVFNIYFCPYCKKTNYGNGSPICGMKLTCEFCKESFSFVNCFFCKQILFWKNPNKYLPCQTVDCANEGCRKKTALIPCPFCQKINYFSRGVFILGQKYVCSYRECKNEFIILYCGNCNLTHIKKSNIDLKDLYTCDNCKKIMPTVQCPKCLKFCSLVNNSKIETHSIFKCPYESCGQIFYYYSCPFCNHDYNTETYNCINLKCPFPNCNKIYTFFKCKKCLKDNYIENDDSNKMDLEEENCSYCNEINKIINEPDKNKFVNIKKVNITQGEKYDFDNPEEDPFDRDIINSLIQIKNYEISSENDSIEEVKVNHSKMCVVCLAKPIEWILVPCGHKCVCPTCGIIIKEKDKKCPICKEIIIGHLDKVIDD